MIRDKIILPPLPAVATPKPDAPDLPEGVKPLADVMQELVEILPGLRAALERQARPARIEPLAYRIDELADALGVSRRAHSKSRAIRRSIPEARRLCSGSARLWTDRPSETWIPGKGWHADDADPLRFLGSGPAHGRSAP